MGATFATTNYRKQMPLSIFRAFDSFAAHVSSYLLEVNNGRFPTCPYSGKPFSIVRGRIERDLRQYFDSHLKFLRVVFLNV
jgi:hypothetical protein